MGVHSVEFHVGLGEWIRHGGKCSREREAEDDHAYSGQAEGNGKLEII
jgi:hypothetical protein